MVQVGLGLVQRWCRFGSGLGRLGAKAVQIWFILGSDLVQIWHPSGGGEGTDTYTRDYMHTSSLASKQLAQRGVVINYMLVLQIVVYCLARSSICASMGDGTERAHRTREPTNMSFMEVSELVWASELKSTMDYQQEFLNNFKIHMKQQPLGHGTFGKVFAAHRTRDGKESTYAVKLMESKAAAEDEEQLAYWAQEWHIWHTLCPHPNILRGHEVYYGEVETRPKVAMVSELADRDLRAFIKQYYQVEVVDAHAWVTDLCTGLGHMHSCHIAHRDMTPANCMLIYQPGAQLKLVIGGLGQAAVLHPVEARHGGEGTPRTCSLKEFPCTWEYAAPEVVHKQCYDFKLDVWSAGAILWQMLQAPI